MNIRALRRAVIAFAITLVPSAILLLVLTSGVMQSLLLLGLLLFALYNAVKEYQEKVGEGYLISRKNVS